MVHDGSRRPRILVVDDDRPILDLIGQILDDEYDVDLCGDAASALQHAHESPPDLAIVDAWLSGSSTGWELASQLKANPATRDIALIMCTALDDRSFAEHDRFIRRHGVQVVQKPFDIEAFVATVARLLDDGGE